MSEDKKNTPNARKRTNNIHYTLDELEKKISDLLEKRKKVEDQIDQIHNDFKSEVIGSEDNKKEDGELSILEEIKDTQSKIDNYYCELFEGSDAAESTKDKIDSFTKRIEEIKEILEGVQQFAQNSKTSISTMEGECGTKKGKIGEILSESNTLVQEIKELYDEIQSFNKKIDEREKLIEKQDSHIKQSQETLDKLNEESQKLFEEWTDQSLHNAFKKEAREKKEEHKKYFQYVIYCLGGGVFLLLLMQIGSHAWWHFSDFEMWFTRFVVFIPIGYISWLCTSKSNIFLKLSEEYQHKASIAEALSGYRKLWNLEHNSSEYREFFDKTIADIIANPSDKIKISNKDMFDKVCDTDVNIVKNENNTN